jgi:thiol-disulfide isomerase/thioredoxin/tetratricopeptide (TPR) repeat protein
MKVVIFALLTVIFTFNGFAQGKKSVASNPNVAIQQVKALFFKRDFNGGSALALKLIEKFPDNLELKAWYVINQARGDDSQKALEYAQDLVKKYGENEWTLIALTVAEAYSVSEKSLVTGEKLIKIAPGNEEAVFAYTSALFRNDKDKEAVEWLEKNRDVVRDRARLLVGIASSSYYVESKKEKGDKKKVFDLFAEAVKLNPLSVDANYYFGFYLTRDKKINEAIPYLQKAVQLSPNVSNLRTYLWQRLESQTGKTDEQKKTELEKAISQYLAQTKNSPEALLAAWNKYRDLAGWKEEGKTEYVKKRDDFQKIILQKYPNTKFDEEIAFSQISTVYGKYFAKDESSKNLEILLKRKSKRTPEEIKFFEDHKKRNEIYQTEQIVLRRAYLKRPKHFDNSKLGNVYLNLLYQLAGKKDSTDEEISDLLKGALEFNKNYYGNLNDYLAGVLLNRQKEHPNSAIAKDAEKYARLGIEEAEKKVKELSKDAKTDKIYELKLPPFNTLANILIKQEKLDEAEKVLAKASEMKDTTDGQNINLKYGNFFTDKLWADFYAAKKDWAKAEDLYLKSTGEDEDFIRTTFEKFYELKNGKKDGFDEYFVGIEAKLKVKAKEKALASRIKEPKEMIPFTLKTIDDKTVSSADLKGKVIVINVWGVWCGPCVAEMPELQKVYEKYKDDKDVALLTIDHGDELPKVKKFMEEKKYTLPVLMADGYVDKLPNFSGFPTTLFIDKAGKVSFAIVGASSELIENYSWRIEALKGDKVD